MAAVASEAVTDMTWKMADCSLEQSFEEIQGQVFAAEKLQSILGQGIKCAYARKLSWTLEKQHGAGESSLCYTKRQLMTLQKVRNMWP